jgi:sugar phosphate isomerase/epimerase
VCQITTRDWTFEQGVRGYAAAGVRGLSVWWDKLQAFGPKAAARLLADAGLRAVSMVGLPPLLAGDAGMSEASFSTMMSALDACHALGIDRIGLVPGPSRGRSVERLDGLVVTALQNLAPHAIARGVVLALEPVRNPYLDYLNTLEHADRLVKAAGRDAVGLLFDVWHLCQESDLWAHVAASAPRISLVHVSDWREPTRCHDDRLIPGEGVLPLQQILLGLDRAGYRGFYDVEIFSPDVWGADYADVLRRCRSFFDAIDWDSEPQGQENARG